MYFKSFPELQYQFPDGQVRFYKDITIRPAIVDEVFGDSRNLQEFTIKDGDTPETVAYDVYGDAQMHWVIMLANNVNSIYVDWPKTTDELSDYLENKYKDQVDSDGNDVVLTGDNLNEFIEFKGSPTNNFISMNDQNVVLKPIHFQDEDGDIYSYDTATATENSDAFGRSVVAPEFFPVSIFEYEEKLNEEKRTIYVPKTSIAQQMRSELGNIVNG